MKHAFIFCNELYFLVLRRFYTLAIKFSILNLNKLDMNKFDKLFNKSKDEHIIRLMVVSFSRNNKYLIKLIE